MYRIAVDGQTRRMRQDRPFLKEASNASARSRAQHSSQAIERRESTFSGRRALRRMRSQLGKAIIHPEHYRSGSWDRPRRLPPRLRPSGAISRRRRRRGGGRQRAAAEPEIIAHHFTEAGLDDLAIEWWGKAGDQALRRSAFQEAIAHLGKATRVCGSSANKLRKPCAGQPSARPHRRIRHRRVSESVAGARRP